MPTATSQNTVVTVLGARSGTSALAGTLGRIGCALPRNLMPANWANPKGFFEPQDLADAHDELLASISSHWDDWRPIPASWFDTPAAFGYRRRLATIYRQNYADASLAVLKEPRMARLLPLWTGVFEELGIQPAFCFIDRPPLEVAASLRARDGSSIAHGLLYYLRNHLDAEYATRSYPRVFLSYNELMTDWRSAVSRVGEVLGIGFTSLNEGQADVDAFLDNAMRHHDRSTIEPADSTPSDMALAVHAAFNLLAKDASDRAAMNRLDQLRRELPRLWSRLTWSYASRLARTVTSTLSLRLRGI